MEADTITRPADVSDVTPATPPTHTAGVNASRSGGAFVRKSLAWTVYAVAVAGLLVVAYGMHQRANAAPVQPTWQQRVVTIDDERAVALAQSWGAPFAVEYAADADITVGKQSHADMVAGEATKTVDGDRITGCRITVESPSDVVMLHEVGHCLGLHHDNGASKSLMYWIQGGNSGADSVTDHDRAALADLYEGTN